MSEQRNITIQSGGDDVTVEVSVGFEKPASIDIALYGPDKKKRKDIGSAFSGDASNPQGFIVGARGSLAELQGCIVGVFVAVSSFSASDDEIVTVSSQVRQGSNVVPNANILATGHVRTGGGGIILAYNLVVA